MTLTKKHLLTVMGGAKSDNNLETVVALEAMLGELQKNNNALRDEVGRLKGVVAKLCRQLKMQQVEV